MKQICQYIDDNDLYKFTTQCAIFMKFPKEKAGFKFINRGKERFDINFVKKLKEQIKDMELLTVNERFISFLKLKLPFIPNEYLNYLKDYKFNPNEVNVTLTSDNNLHLEIYGLWHRITLWEVPLLYIISELYFQDKHADLNQIYRSAIFKGQSLKLMKANYIEFGTRRRFSFDVQSQVLLGLMNIEDNTLLGTSNCFFARNLGLNLVGTYPHEWIMAHQVLGDINKTNENAMNNWLDVFKGNLNIALPDTITTKQFLKEFNLELSQKYAGTRQDSGKPNEYIDLLVNHYQSLGIDPMTKKIIFSDNLNLDKVRHIIDCCKGKIQYSFGIGTYLTNDIPDNKALNIVIKLYSINDLPVVKLSDENSKECGDSNAIKGIKKIINE